MAEANSGQVSGLRGQAQPGCLPLPGQNLKPPRWAALPVDDGDIRAERLTAFADHLEATHRLFQSSERSVSAHQRHR